MHAHCPSCLAQTLTPSYMTYVHYALLIVCTQDESEDLGDCLPLNGRLEVRCHRETEYFNNTNACLNRMLTALPP
jgi:hypothetical protein